MTPVQKSEARRLTPLMRDLLKLAWTTGDGWWITKPHHLRSARILERRGFAVITPEPGGHLMTLTDAGDEIFDPSWRTTRA